MEIRCIHQARSALSESVLWSPQEKKLYWLDQIRPEIHCLDPVTGEDVEFPLDLPAQLGALVPYAGGSLVLVAADGITILSPDMKSRRQMLPFVVLGCGTTLYILWALTAFPLQLYVKANSIVYINQATNNTAVAILYVIATCGSLFFSRIKMMVVFGVANLAIVLVVMGIKRYAFTSVWCAYAAIASVIILAYFWTSSEERPFRYA